jgi:hypothetical protein
MSYAAACAAILRSSVSPPTHMTSGWRMEMVRGAMSARKPYFVYSCWGSGHLSMRRRGKRNTYLARRKLDMRQRLLDECIALGVVGVKHFLPPLDIQG